jgi:hypothetical protein
VKRTRLACAAPERAAADVAILFTPKKDAYADQRPRALFSAVDGKHVGTDMAGYPAATRVLPGDVLVKVNCTIDDPHPRWDSFLLFRATLKAGHYYELACDRVTASAIDRGTSYESIRHLLPDTINAKLAQ